MRAVVVNRPGGPDALEVVRLPDPRPGPGEVLVDVAAAGVNFIDVYHRSGRYPLPTPFVPGQEGAGTVLALGPGGTELAEGDVVAWANLSGSYADRVVLPADRLVPIPAGVPAELAAAVLLQGMTAHYLTHDTYRVRSGDLVLVHAAAGGTGQLVTRFATRNGGRVVGTASTAEKGHAARLAGAVEVVGYADQEVLSAVRDLTDGVGAAAVYDGVGAPTFDTGLAALRPRGTLAVYGQSGGAVPPVDLQRLNAAGSVFVTRPNLAHHIADRAELLERAAAVFTLVRSTGIDTHVGRRFALDDVREAHRALEARATVGKTLLVP
ncbi:quinone oxidoreductase [Micromonospora sp. NPDC005171]|uniref:quinone oxidoreductase family protein n=1 Tax=Micromonospora sp. NPDC005171 TaxID=3156866 RepID=UPI0033B6DC26